MVDWVGVPPLHHPANAQEPTQAGDRTVATPASFTATQTVSKILKVTGAPSLDIRHGDGNVTIQSWSNPAVGIEATIISVANTDSLANQFANHMDVDVEQEGNHFEIITQSPKIDGIVGFQVHYKIFVPVRASVFISNSFGDTSVAGIEGRVTVISSHGRVELRNLGGRVSVNGKGSYDLIAEGLRRGGHFTLQRMKALFLNVSGTLNVHNFRGFVELRSLGRNINATVYSESGPVWLYVPRESAADLDAIVESGEIKSDFDLDRGTQGSFRTAQRINVDATQRIAIDTTFDSIHILEEKTETAASSTYLDDGTALQLDTEPLSHSVTPGGNIVLESGTGDLRIEGTAEDVLTVSGTRWVWAEPREDAREILQSLPLTISQEADGTIRVSSLPDLEQLPQLENVSYRVDLVVRVPLGSPLVVLAKEGQVFAKGIGAPLTVELERGSVRIENAESTLDLNNRLGDIEVLDSVGPVVISGAQGTATLRRVLENIGVSYRDGRVVIDSPGAEATVRHARGDVRIIALHGIHGEINIEVTDGNIGMAVTETADASFLAIAQGGTVEPVFPMTGSIEPDRETFQGLLNKASHHVRLQTTRGNIIFD
jgi:DUF4097 and DUF4098 domain-containing protein YvlB